MALIFFDRQDLESPLNGTNLRSADELAAFLRKPPDRAPFFCELVSESGKSLLIGLDGESGCVQCCSAAGAAPRFIALARGAPQPGAATGYWLGETLTPIPARFRLTLDQLHVVAAVFLRTGGLDPDCTWLAL